VSTFITSTGKVTFTYDSVTQVGRDARRSLVPLLRAGITWNSGQVPQDFSHC